MIRDCPEPRQMVKNISERASRLDTIDDMKRILYEVATQAEDAIFADPDEDEQYKAFLSATDNNGDQEEPVADETEPTTDFYQRMAESHQENSTGLAGIRDDSSLDQSDF
jgi:hypothetical protein